MSAAVLVLTFIVGMALVFGRASVGGRAGLALLARRLFGAAELRRCRDDLAAFRRQVKTAVVAKEKELPGLSDAPQVKDALDQSSRIVLLAVRDLMPLFVREGQYLCDYLELSGDVAVNDIAEAADADTVAAVVAGAFDQLACHLQVEALVNEAFGDEFLLIRPLTGDSAAV
jgi:hypothetical protein